MSCDLLIILGASILAIATFTVEGLEYFGIIETGKEHVRRGENIANSRAKAAKGRFLVKTVVFVIGLSLTGLGLWYETCPSW